MMTIFNLNHIVLQLQPNQRFSQVTPQGAADALLLAELALHYKQHERKTLLVLCANALDTLRLQEEILWFAPSLQVHILPDWETLPYDHFSPHQDLISERLASLYALTQQQTDILLVSATTALHRFSPSSYLAAHTFFLAKKDKLDIDKLRGQFSTAGYQHVTQVVSPGEYSIRGGLIDLFPMGSQLPLRIDLFDNEIESIRTFDPDSQRSLYPIPEVRLLPGREFPFHETARQQFRNRFRETFEGDPTKANLYKDIGNGIAPAGIEYYLPLFFDNTSTIFDYLPPHTICVTHGILDDSIQHFWQDAQQRYRFQSSDISRPILPPTALFLKAEEFFGNLHQYARLALSHEASATPLTQKIPNIAIERRAENPIGKLQSFIDTTPGRILIVAESAGRRTTLDELFRQHGLTLPSVEHISSFLDSNEKVALTIAPLSNGFKIVHDAINFTLITEAELFALPTARRKRRKSETSSNVENMVRDLAELRIGDAVVHSQHGIGRYLGLTCMNLGDGETEFLHLEYDKGSTLYVPVANLHLISRYSGAAQENAPLHQLGSGQWEKARRKAAQKAFDTAAELLNLYARRAARPGHAFQFSANDYDDFAAGFGFDETPDQLAAIQAVIQDMIAAKPMDRLVCGDVGFGKTEVALRAAFIAVMGGKQVAVLAPTTLLAEQHYHTFSDRFANFPVKLAELSRFRSSKEIKASIEGLANGQIDIAIGTHKLLSKEVQFSRLGLVIIDEEHRFGVRQKEALKTLRSEVDILTLTATPIPRTLSMAMEGIRDLSVIATAPQRRLAIKTFVRPESDSTMREAVLRELNRGGQIYFLHNEVDTIQHRAAKLMELIPEARICVAHGQMPERELERVMKDFYQQRFNILLCTTIIETGIDVPSANTIIIHRADKFGLAQLHQLRGRVGRSHHQAYAYLMVPDAGISKTAEKRLDAIQTMEELGSGFYLAMHDLEIRGAGEVLGDEQSGEMHEVGFAMYSDMLNTAIKALKRGETPDLESPLAATTEINLHTPALLPTDYCGDIHERLTLYKRLANCQTNDDIIFMQEELIDRFGKLPLAATALLETHRLRLLAQQIGIQKIDAGDDVAILHFIAKPPIEPIRIIEMIQKHKHIKLHGQDKLKITHTHAALQPRIEMIRQLILQLST